ncbi:Chromosome partition protein Smc [Candidatus Lokiarchaeum ossiferum]|uniref:Chromosome partition protein Smc n=1 Tax=Candidatus Lokiarchaeum ossiferum TaxID=2951803 RepID=A0ABY6HPH9_9ARCH|nr:Chromosome partition protein Smc [Candidatus Lokiarchaeum sp. B-35]
MGDKDLENIISSIGQEEMAVAQKQAQIDRLKQLIIKQKTEMAEQQKLIQELQGRINNMYDLPADIEELKRMVGEMRAENNHKDQQLQMAYGTIAEKDAELKTTKVQIEPLSRNLDTYIAQVGELKAKLIEQNGLINMKQKEIDELQMANEATNQNLEKMEMEFAQRVQARLKQFMDTEDQYQSRISKMEAEFEERTKKMQEQYSVQVDKAQGSVQDTYEQLASLKSDLAQKDVKITILSRELQEANTSIVQEKSTNEALQKEINSIKDNLREKDIVSADFKSKIEAELKNELFTAKSEFTRKINELESQLLDKNLKIQELTQNSQSADKRVIEIKAHLDELMAKNNEISTKYQEMLEKSENQDKTNADLIAFKKKNEGIAKNMEGLMQLFEEEPLFRTYLLVRDVGAMDPGLLKNALGVPSITVQKYIEKFMKVDLFEKVGEKITLKHKLAN